MDINLVWPGIGPQRHAYTVPKAIFGLPFNHHFKVHHENALLRLLLSTYIL